MILSHLDNKINMLVKIFYQGWLSTLSRGGKGLLPKLEPYKKNHITRTKKLISRDLISTRYIFLNPF